MSDESDVDVTNPFDNLDLAIETGGSTLDQRHTSGQTHAVHMSPSRQVIQSVEDDVERLEPADAELAVHDVCMVSFQFHIRSEVVGHVLRHL